MTATRTRRSVNPHFLEVEGATTMNTLGFARTQEAWEDTVAEAGIAVIHGVPGNGKTFATGHAAEQEELPLAAFAFEPRVTVKRLVQAILVQVTGIPHLGSRFELLDTLSDELGKTRRVLLIDEAQGLSHEAIETLRWLWDSNPGKFALILVGGNGCWEHICKYPMLLSRVFTSVAFEPLSPEDVREIIPAYHPIYAEAKPSTIDHIDQRFARGNFRQWASFTDMAQKICSREGKSYVTRPIAEEALDRIGRVIHDA